MRSAASHPWRSPLPLSRRPAAVQYPGEYLNVQDASGAAALGLVVPELSRMLAMRALLVMGGLIGTVAALE